MKKTSKKPQSEEELKSEETEDTLEFKPEIQIPNNIEININETPSGKIEEVSENTEEDLDESGRDFGSSDFVPSSRFNSNQVNPFLEQLIEPVENLERNLQGGSGTSFAQRANQEVQNAPQYSPSSRNYSNKGYYEEPTDDTYPETIRPMQAGLRTNISLPFDDLPKARLLNPNDTTGWRNQEDSGYPGEQKYKFSSETKKRRDIL